jgi:hypothetical protein
MSNRSCLRVVALLAAALAPSSGHAQHLDAAGISDTAAFVFLRQLQSAVRRDDAAALWELTTGDVLVDWPDSEEHIRTGDRFLARYHAIVTDSIRQRILRQVPESLFATARGVVLIHRGTVVFGRWGARVALLVVTEPGWTGFFRRPLPKLDVNFVPRGRWWPVGFSCAGDACGDIDPQDSISAWRNGLTLTSNLVVLGADTCRTPAYTTRRVPGNNFLDDWKFRPHALDLNDSLVTEVEIGCPTDWYGPHGHLLLVQDSTHIWATYADRFIRLTPFRATRPSSH